jgi:hypothetical protein
MPTKKTPTKSKKATPKKATKKKASAKKKPLVVASDEKLFWLTTGMALAHLLDLEQALSTIEEEHYVYHANGESNDFAAWVDLVLCDEDCASSLRRARTQSGAKRAVSKYLKMYDIS